jgi:hypothetical protein
MIANPRKGQRVQLWYGSGGTRKRPSLHRDRMPWHGRIGVVVVSSRGKPRNHGVRMDDGTVVVVPCGNLRPPLRQETVGNIGVTDGVVPSPVSS